MLTEEQTDRQVNVVEQISKTIFSRPPLTMRLLEGIDRDLREVFPGLPIGVVDDIDVAGMVVKAKLVPDSNFIFNTIYDSIESILQTSAKSYYLS